MQKTVEGGGLHKDTPRLCCWIAQIHQTLIFGHIKSGFSFGDLHLLRGNCGACSNEWGDLGQGSAWSVLQAPARSLGPEALWGDVRVHNPFARHPSTHLPRPPCEKVLPQPPAPGHTRVLELGLWEVEPSTAARLTRSPGRGLRASPKSKQFPLPLSPLQGFTQPPLARDIPQPPLSSAPSPSHFTVHAWWHFYWVTLLYGDTPIGVSVCVLLLGPLQ